MMLKVCGVATRAGESTLPPGGRIVVRPPTGARFVPEENVIVGNTVLYGATAGEAYFAGVAGERFAVPLAGDHRAVRLADVASEREHEGEGVLGG